MNKLYKIKVSFFLQYFGTPPGEARRGVSRGAGGGDEWPTTNAGTIVSG